MNYKEKQAEIIKMVEKISCIRFLNMILGFVGRLYKEETGGKDLK